MIITAYAIAVDIPLLTRRIPIPPLPSVAAPAGLLTQTVGLAIRGWSMHTLGRSYSRTLRAEADAQRVVDAGPYRLVRHPGYLASVLIWAGFALTSRNAPALALITGLLGGAYARRITTEEQLLRRELPGYTTYSTRTKKLIPFLW